MINPLPTAIVVGKLLLETKVTFAIFGSLISVSFLTNFVKGKRSMELSLTRLEREYQEFPRMLPCDTTLEFRQDPS